MIVSFCCKGAPQQDHHPQTRYCCSDCSLGSPQVRFESFPLRAESPKSWVRRPKEPQGYGKFFEDANYVRRPPGYSSICRGPKLGPAAEKLLSVGLESGGPAVSVDSPKASVDGPRVIVGSAAPRSASAAPKVPYCTTVRYCMFATLPQSRVRRNEK